MTEAEWDGCTESRDMLAFLSARKLTSRRKRRLFCCACARLTWGTTPKQWRAAVEVAEKYADGAASNADRAGAFRSALRECGQAFRYAAAVYACYADASQANARSAAYFSSAVQPGIRPPQADLLRDLFNPFRPVAVDAAWLAWQGGTISRLAQAAYDQRELPSGHLDAARLAVLADGLEEAGCGDPRVLAHLRSPGPHVRGCHVLDALLDRE
jgi:hypothetical protein